MIIDENKKENINNQDSVKPDLLKKFKIIKNLRRTEKKPTKKYGLLVIYGNLLV